MSLLKIFSENDAARYINKRCGETKFGEKIGFVSSLNGLKKHPSKYVLLGIPEDIGVRANSGNPGTSEAWEVALRSILNIQHNTFTNAETVLLLGEIDCEHEMAEAAKLSKDIPNYVEKLGELVSKIDAKVSEVIQKIVVAGKFPIIIGGGHNNSYGNLKGTSEALDKAVNCINFDAHTDFRALEHRHSGNGFSYAFKNGYLNHYFIFGLHRNYTSQAVFESMEKHSDRVQFNLFESIAIDESVSFSEAIKEAETFCCNDDFGIELDMDAIEGMGSSAITPSGFTVSEARKFVAHFSKMPNARYLHLCEASPVASPFANQVAKTIAYLVSDVISKKC